MELYGIKMHKDDLPNEKYTAEEFLSELERYKEELQAALDDNALECKRMATLSSPIFYDYVQAHAETLGDPKALDVFHHNIGILTAKYLKKIEELEEILKADPSLAELLAKSLDKPHVPRDMIIPTPLDRDLEPKMPKKH